MADLHKNEISVAVRIRPLTEKETALLQQVDYSTPFTGDGSLAAAPSSSSSAPNATSAYLSGRSPNSFVRKVVKALDDRVLVFDPPETNPMTSYQKQLLGPSVKKVKDMRYCFDRVFDETAGQQDVFEGCAQHLVPGVLDGYNGTVFAYGVGEEHQIGGVSSLIAQRDTSEPSRPSTPTHRLQAAARLTLSAGQRLSLASCFS